MAELHTSLAECIDIVARRCVLAVDRSDPEYSKIPEYIDAFWSTVRRELEEDDEDTESAELGRDTCYELLHWWWEHPLLRPA